MKKILLSVLSFATFATAQAQPTLTAATNNPVVGDAFIGHDCSTTGVTTGVSGAGVTWDYSTLSTTSTDTTTFVTCASTPYCDSFTGSNIAAINGTSFSYANESSTGVSLLGAYSGGIYIHYATPQQIIFYPMSMGATSSTSSTIVFDTTYMGFPVSVYIIQNDAFTVESWGTLTLPSGTYNNVLRVHQVTNNYDSAALVGVIPGGQTETYSWYVSGFHSPLLMISTDTAGSGTPSVTDAKYYTQSSADVKNVASTVNSLNMYPNPATDVAHLSFDLKNVASASVVVTDIMGREVANISNSSLVAGHNDISIPVSNLAAGVYIVKIQSATDHLSSRLVVNK